MRKPTGKTPKQGAPKRGGTSEAARLKPDEAKTCPIAATMAVLGDRWSVLIMRDLLLGLRRFDELVKSLGIATNILTDRLNKLTDEGLTVRRAYQENPTRFEYVPTSAGEDFRKVIMSIGDWGAAWRIEPQGRTPFHYVNEETGNPITVVPVDRETGEKVAADKIKGAKTEWADDLVDWRIATGEAHRNADESSKD